MIAFSCFPVIFAEFQKILFCMAQIGSFSAAHGDFPAWATFQTKIDQSGIWHGKNCREQSTADFCQNHPVFADVAAGREKNLWLKTGLGKKVFFQLEHGRTACDEDEGVL